MKGWLLIPVVGLAVVACQTSPTTTTPAATTLPQGPAPTAAPTAVPIVEPTAAPTQAPTSAPTAAPTQAPAATQAPTPAPATADAWVNAGGGLNLRAEPTGSASVVQLLPFGTHVNAIGSATAPDAAGIAWQNVRTDDGLVGWVAAQYLASAAPAPPAAASPAPTAPPTTSYLYVASVGGLNMRAAPSVSSRIVTMLADGQRLETNGLTSGPDASGITWVNVKTHDLLEGWVSAEYVRTQVPSVAPAAPPDNVSDDAADILRRTNDLRAQNGLPALILNADLMALALAHSQYMAQNGITHIGPGGLSARNRIANAGYGQGTENIYGGEASIDDAWEYWATDPPHRDNLLHQFHTVVGIGVYQIGRQTFYTMDFGKPAP